MESIVLPFVGGSKDAIEKASIFGYIFGSTSYTGSLPTSQKFLKNGDRYVVTYYIPSSLKSVMLTGGYLNYGAFSDCSSLTSIVIPEGVACIGERAFEGCSSLTSITIPEGVTNIEWRAFYGCSSLTDVTCLATTPPTCGSSPFSIYGTLHVLPNYGDAYRMASGWWEFTTMEEGIYASTMEGRNGTQLELPILLKNANEVSGFEFDLKLPEGVTVAEDEDNMLIVDQSFVRTTSRKTDHFDAEYKADGTLHVECYLKSGQTFTDNDGEVCVIALQIDELMEGGTYPIMLKNILIKGLDESQDVSIERIKSTLSIRSEITLADGATYSNNKEMMTNQLTYTRSFSNGNWQAMYIPFAISTETLAENGLEVARINNVNQYDYEDDGTVDETAVEIFRLRNGSTKPNTVYMIRAKETGDKVITMEDVTLYPAQENSHSVTSWDTEFTFVGTYHTITGQEMLDGEYFAMGGGMLHQTSSSANDLKPQRWYMTVTDREGNKKNVNEVKVFLYGEEDLETGIVTLYAQPERGEGIYDLSGRKTSGTQKGVYIKNGKKVMR